VRRFAILALLLLPAALVAQSPVAATGGEASLSAGGEYTTFNPDWGCPKENSPFKCWDHQLMGPTAFFDFNLRRKWGVEGEGRWLEWNGQGGMTISNYLVGGRYQLVRLGRLTGWGKLLVGGGWIQTPNYPEAGSLKGSFFAYAPGATVQYPFGHRLALRGDYEYQIWPSFFGPASSGSTGTQENNNGLTPNGFSVGIAYRILGQ
jgi:Outer membrane protein beta-barrel domain